MPPHVPPDPLAPPEPLRWTAVLGTERAMRIRIGQYLVAFAMMALHACLVLLIAWRDDLDPGPVLLWVGLSATVYATFYGLLRSGRSAAWSDPSMTQAQVLASLALTAASYPFFGSVRAVVPGEMVVILSFGMFRLSRGLVWRAAGLAWAMLAIAVAWNPMEAGTERSYDATVLATAVLIFGATGFLAEQLTRIRARLSAQREQLNEALARIEELAHRDALTGLFNRRFGDALLQQALTRQRRDPGHALSVVLLDLDHFKRINDRHGHAVGDAVLKAFANAGRETFREGDTFVRWGGEEFLLVLTGTDPSATHLALARLRAALTPALAAQDALAVLGEGYEGQPAVTFSAGLTAWRPGDNTRTLLERADRALYRAKDEGRDRVVAE